MTLPLYVQGAWFVGALLFIFGLKGMSSPASARRTSRSGRIESPMPAATARTSASVLALSQRGETDRSCASKTVSKKARPELPFSRRSRSQAATSARVRRSFCKSA